MDNINIALIKWHNDNSSKKYYDEVEFFYKRQWDSKDGNIVISRWDLDSPKPSESDLMKYTTDDINNEINTIDEIQTLKSHKGVVVTENKEFLKNYAQSGSMVYENSSKKLYVFVKGEWVKV